MIRIELTDDDLAQTRLALSPLWELIASLFVLNMPEPPTEHAAWVARTRIALRGVELGPLDGILPSRPGVASYVPDFLAPIPSEPLAGLAAEIEAVRATDPAVVRAHLSDCWGAAPPPPWDAFVTRPREMLDRVADALRAYWQAALADDWPRLRAVVEGELLCRARALALSGPKRSSRSCTRACAGAVRWSSWRRTSTSRCICRAAR